MNAWRAVEKAGQIAIAVLIAVSIAELAFYFALRSRVYLYSSRDVFPAPSGYLLDNRYMAATAAKCYLVRLSSDNCPYCRQDQTEYTQLVQRAQKMNCESIIMAPIAGQIKLDNDSPSMQLQYVDLKLGLALRPIGTPETILLDSRGSPVWQREGAMDEDALEGALRTLGKIR